jgi:anti-sigma B factor antagonist
MTAQQPRLPDLRHLHEAGKDLTDGVRATIADGAETILVTLTRGTGAGLAGAGDPLTVVAIEGEIDLNTAPLVRLALSHALDGRTAVCCDLSEVTFFGAAATNTVLAAHQQAAALHLVFFLRGVHGLVGRVLAILDPDRLVARQG